MICLALYCVFDYNQRHRNIAYILRAPSPNGLAYGGRAVRVQRETAVPPSWKGDRQSVLCRLPVWGRLFVLRGECK